MTVCNADLLTDIPDKPHDILHKAKKESTWDSFSTQVFIIPDAFEKCKPFFEKI